MKKDKKLKRKEIVLEDFHDSVLISMDFTDWTRFISLILYCPNAGIFNGDIRYYKVSFYRILFFGFEVACIGVLNENIPIANIIKIEESEELNAWRKRIEELAEPDPVYYPEGMKDPEFKEIYHFIIDSPEFRNLICLPWNSAFQILCRHYEIEDVTYQMPHDSPIFDTRGIPSD